MKAKVVTMREALAQLERRDVEVVNRMFKRWRRDLLAKVERRVALRFLARALRLARKLEGGDGDISVGALHQIGLWRVVVAASHNPGTFDGKRKGER